MVLISGIILAVLIEWVFDIFGITEPKIVHVLGISESPKRKDDIQDPDVWRIHLAYKAKFRNDGIKSGFIDKITVEPTGLIAYPKLIVINIDKTPIKWREERIVNYEVILEVDREHVKNKSDSKHEFKLYIYDNTGKQVHWITSTLHIWCCKDKEEITTKLQSIARDIKPPEPLGIEEFDSLYCYVPDFLTLRGLI